MYPRSCRENIRINYVAQQLAALDEAFNVETSLYGDTRDDVHLYSSMRHGGTTGFEHSLVSEARLRLALHTVTKRDAAAHEGVSIPELTDVIQIFLDALPEQTSKLISAVAAEKIASEYDRLDREFALSKAYINAALFDSQGVVAFSSFLETLFTQSVKSESLNQLFSSSPQWCPQRAPGTTQLPFLDTDSHGRHYRVRFTLDSHGQAVTVLAPIVRAVRMSWFVALSNLLKAIAVKDGVIEVGGTSYPMVPLLARADGQGSVHLFERVVTPLSREEVNKQEDTLRDAFMNLTLFELAEPQSIPSIGLVCGEPFYLDPRARATERGVYAYNSGYPYFSATGLSDGDVYEGLGITTALMRYHRTHDNSIIMSTSDAYDALMRDDSWRNEWRERLKGVREHKQPEKKDEKKNDPSSGQATWPRERPMHLVDQKLVPAVRLVARALATLEMVVRDVDADIVIRPGNKQDFIAAIKLFEHVTLPEYFRLICDKPLFDDYDVVEPCIPIRFTT